MRVFFFKQKTAYEIKECDWSSDVCSSDLRDRRRICEEGGGAALDAALDLEVGLHEVAALDEVDRKSVV